MAKAASKSKKAPAKSKPSASGRAKATPSARKALTSKAPAKPGKPTVKPSTAKPSTAKPSTVKPVAVKPAPKPAAKKVVDGKIATRPVSNAVKAGKWVYTFGDGKAEGKAEMRDLLGGKGANLAEMANLGLPVPPGFSIPTSV